jgi:hypothetical protein
MIRGCGRSIAHLGLAAILVGVLAGCGGKKWQYNEQVEGTLKLDGAPVSNVLIQFYPDVDASVQAPLSSSYTDEKGHFQLTVESQNKPGAVIGKHNVVVLPGRAGGQGGEGEGRKLTRVPSAYTLATTTPLQVEIKPDQHDYPLKLSSAAQARK